MIFFVFFAHWVSTWFCSFSCLVCGTRRGDRTIASWWMERGCGRRI